MPTKYRGDRVSYIVEFNEPDLESESERVMMVEENLRIHKAENIDIKIPLGIKWRGYISPLEFGSLTFVAKFLRYKHFVNISKWGVEKMTSK